MAEVKQDRKYVKTHEWIFIEDGVATLGITDYAQSELGDLVFVEAEPVGEELDVEDIFGSIESVKAASDLFTPVAGEIVEVNEDLEDAPEEINEDPYGSWIVKIKLADDADLSDLIDADEYAKFCEEEA